MRAESGLRFARWPTDARCIRVLDADTVQLGRLEQDFSTDMVATAINGDGTRAYVLLRGDRKLHIYDLPSPPVNGVSPRSVPA